MLKTDTTAFVSPLIDSSNIDEEIKEKWASEKKTLNEWSLSFQLASVSLEKGEILDRNVLSCEEKVFGMAESYKTPSKRKFIKTLLPKKENIYKPILGEFKFDSNKIEQYLQDFDIGFQKLAET